METKPTVREQILDHAITLMMQRGYNGFSYRDLSDLVSVKTSSIHYYFPSKDDLVLEAVAAYSDEVLAAVRAIDPALPADVKLSLYTKMFGRTLGDGNLICLCGMLASDIETLPENVRQAVQAFFTANERWLAELLAQGAKEGTLQFSGEPDTAARTLYAAFQGSVLASRLFHTRARLEDVEAVWKARS
ncbi:TetR family transcriptional regulator [Burkholderia cenocepacia]|uniref:TetR family transcriptional regulator n=1 Tax=Burkholderia cenocepacia TaxID=95486 RepID=A0A6J5J9Z0_9BURK|nr:MULTISPECIES: TetR/AcrR family transcriptional regulator [Burkholderia cepacia complex]CAB3968512.1 TetR family transcriptional regulator [Burkholderia cenocepacia]